MISLLKRLITIKTPALINGSVDVHTHLLPGVDDGLSNQEEAQQAIARYEELGVSHVFLTPHIMADYPKNHVENLRQQFAAFQQQCPSTVQFHLAAEYMLDAAFLDHLNNGPLTYDGKHILVETSYISPPSNFDTLIYNIQLSNYIPVLAHPERYTFFSLSQLQHLVSIGVRLQLNISSLRGAYGRHVQKTARKLLRGGYYHFVGSDLHRVCQLSSPHIELRLTPREHQNFKKLILNNQSLISPTQP